MATCKVINRDVEAVYLQTASASKQIYRNFASEIRPVRWLPIAKTATFFLTRWRLLARALEVLSSRGGWNLWYHTNVWGLLLLVPLLLVLLLLVPPPPCYRNIHHTIHIMHFTSVKVIWRLLDELRLFSSINTVARSTFIKVFTSFKITYFPFTSS